MVVFPFWFVYRSTVSRKYWFESTRVAIDHIS